MFQRLRGQGIVERHTFVVAGWKHYWRASAKLWLVSNCEDEDFQMAKDPYEEFVILPVRPDPFQVIITGTQPAVDPATLPRITSQLKAKLGALEISDSLVNEIRLAATHPKYGTFVGQNCMTVTTMWDGKTNAMYYPAHGWPIQYAPNVITTYPDKDGDARPMITMKGVAAGGGDRS